MYTKNVFKSTQSNPYKNKYIIQKITIILRYNNSTFVKKKLNNNYLEALVR